MEDCGRIWEIDFLRGMAIVLMVAFHLAVDLTDYYGWTLNYMSGFWFYTGQLSAILFIFLAGISTRFNRRLLRHGLHILGWGMAVSLGTYLYEPTIFVRFGILHLIGSGVILASFLRKIAGGQKLFVATLMLAGGAVAGRVPASGEWLVPLGVTPAGFTTLDYYPLLPWGGVVLLGAGVSDYIYKIPRSLLKEQPQANILTYMGRRSLYIYLLHQPVLLALLWLIFRH